ncbi:hypothetical protein U1738_10850 [Sphingomonas sp. GB1N7]
MALKFLREKLAVDAGVDPNSGFFLSDEATSFEHETPMGRADREEYLQTFRNRALGEIAGLIEGCHIRVWNTRNGGLEIAAPVFAAQIVFEGDDEVNHLCFDRAEWDAAVTSLHPEFSANISAPETDCRSAPVPPAGKAWSEAKMKAAIERCEIQNREEAWSKVFLPRRSEHGWDNNAFRLVWPEARGTKGMKGRPVRRH